MEKEAERQRETDRPSVREKYERSLKAERLEIKCDTEKSLKERIKEKWKAGKQSSQTSGLYSESSYANIPRSQ